MNQSCVPGNRALTLTQPFGSVGHGHWQSHKDKWRESSHQEMNAFMQKHVHHTSPTQSPCLQHFYQVYPPWYKWIIFLKCRVYYMTLKTLKTCTLLREHSTSFFIGLHICTLSDSNQPSILSHCVPTIPSISLAHTEFSLFSSSFPLGPLLKLFCLKWTFSPC